MHHHGAHNDRLKQLRPRHLSRAFASFIKRPPERRNRSNSWDQIKRAKQPKVGPNQISTPAACFDGRSLGPLSGRSVASIHRFCEALEVVFEEMCVPIEGDLRRRMTRHSLHYFTLVPAEIARLAAVCRRSCGTRSPKPTSATMGVHMSTTVEHLERSARPI